MTAISTRHEDGFRMVTSLDDFAENPFCEPALMKLVQFHRKYGETHGFENLEAVRAYAKRSGAFLVDAYLHDHTSVHYTASPTSGWDSGQVGFVVFEAEYVVEIAKHLYVKPSSKRVTEKLKLIADSMLSQYSEYANGWVYRLEIFAAGDDDDEPAHDICGLYGDEEVDKEINRFLRRHREALMPPPRVHFSPQRVAFV